MNKLTVKNILNRAKIKEIENLITESQFREMEKITEYYTIGNLSNRLDNIKSFILCGVDKNWVARLRIIQRKLKSDTLSEYSCKIRYGDKWKEVLNEHKHNVRVDKPAFIRRYGEKKGIEKWKIRNEKVKSYGLDIMVKRYGEEIGSEKWKKTLAQKVETMRIRKLIKPYRNGQTLAEYQNRYGIELGYEKWDKKQKNASYRYSLLGFTDKYGEDDGKKLWEDYCKSMNKTSIDSFIGRYGEEIGSEKYNKFVEKCKYNSSLERYIEKYGEVDGKLIYNEIVKKKVNNNNDRYSKVSQELFWHIYNLINNKDCYFAELNQEYLFYPFKCGLTVIAVDFKCGNKIIEFDGTYWHTTEKQKNIDKTRDEFLKSKGYEILRVDEKYYYKNKPEIIEECIKFINK